ncbi:MAG: APC family permease [Candidatus Thermoplasmatota archaeon]|nr:APC family permease [Candidatus Thermoplasmatota archaeon]
MTGGQSGSGSTLKRNNLSLGLILFQAFGMAAPAAGVGIFLTGTTGLVVGSTPMAVLIGWIIFSIGLNANYQLSKKYVSAGGYYSYIGSGLNKGVGFFAGGLYGIATLLNVGIFGFMQTTVFIYLLLPQISSIPYAWVFIMLVIAAFMIGITYWGIKPNLRYMMITGVVEVAVILIGGISLIVLAGHANTLQVFTPSYALASHKSTSTIFLAIVLAAEIMTGSGSVIALSEESRSPTDHIRKALRIIVFLVGIPIIVLSYALVVSWGPNSMSTFTSSPDPGVILFLNHLGIVAAIIFSAVVVNSSLSAGLSNYNAATRTIYGMSREKLFPHYFSYVSPKSRTPSRLVIFTGAVGIILSLLMMAEFGVYNGFFVAAIVTTVPMFIAHVLINITVPVDSIKSKERRAAGTILYKFILPAIAAILFATIIVLSLSPPYPPMPFFAGIVGVFMLIILVFVWAVYVRLRKPELLKGTPLNFSEGSGSATGGSEE